MEFSYAHGVSDQPLIGETIGENFDRMVAEVPEREFLVSVFEGKRFTYAEFAVEVVRCARALMALGIGKGDRVGCWATNCVEWVLVQFATAKLGAILVNINPAYRLHELEYALKQSECNYLIAGEGFRDTDYVEMLHELIPELMEADGMSGLEASKFQHLKHVIYLGEKKAAGLINWKDLMTRQNQTTPEQVAQVQASLDFDEIINIQYTSGTTGFPKGASLTHHGILNNGYWCGARMAFSSADRLCIPVPFYHCFGMVMGTLTCVTHGAAMVLPAPHFSPLATLKALSTEKCTAVHGVPTMFIAQLEHPEFGDFDLSSLRTGTMAGAPCPVELMHRVINDMHCPEITIACGQTEASPVCNQTEVDDTVEVRTTTVGKVLPHQEQKIIDVDTGRMVLRGTQGEACYRGYHIMRGYYNNPEGTAAVIDKDGWLHSGDLAVMDEYGYLKITGRLKDMIIRGGENIYPREIEEFLFTHPKIAEAYVFGVPDDYYGEQAMAWVKLKEGETMTEDEVRLFCDGNIMSYKIPTYVKVVAEFPTTVTGKVQKFRMRELAVEELGL